MAAQEVAPKIMNAGGRRFTPKTAPTATKRQATVTEVRRRRRCTDVITSTCVFVIGLFLVLVLSLPAHPHAVKAAFPGFQLPTIPAPSKRQPISRMLNRKNRLWFVAEHLIRNGGVLDGFDVEGSRLVCTNDATGAARAALFDLLISAKQYRWRYGKTERLDGLEIHYHLEFRRQLNG